MIERGRPRRSFPAPIPVGESGKVFCSGCTGRVDPLRAARVAIFSERFHYFCSPECRVRFVPGSRPPPSHERARPSLTSRSRSSLPGEPAASPRLESEPPVSRERLARAPRSEAPSTRSSRSPGSRGPLARERSERAPNLLDPPPPDLDLLVPPRDDEDGAAAEASDSPERDELDGAQDDGNEAGDDALDDDTLAAEDERDGGLDADALDADPRAAPATAARSGWLVAALGLGVLAAASSVPLTPLAALPVATLSAAASSVALLVALGSRMPTGPRLGLLPPVAAGLLAPLAAWLWPALRLDSARLAGVVCAVSAGSTLWIGGLRSKLSSARFRFDQALGGAAAGDLKPGQELVLRAGQRLSVDVVITAGQARVEPWPGSRLRLARGEGDGMLAGARVVDGALRAVVRWVGHDRAWARLSTDPLRRADRHLALARLAERLSTSWALGLGALAGAISLALDVHPALAAGNALGLAAALSNVALAELVALGVELGLGRLCARGICFRSPAALDRAGRTSSVVFCDRGALLAGELSVASIEPAGNMTSEELLALLAGAHAGVPSPLGTALSGALAAHKLRADATRSPNHIPGLGVTAVASNGQALVAGSRALLLERRISVASAEARIAELEAQGRSVLLAALDGRWVGLVALQDGLRPGARAATQYLLESGVEPVLLSGEARETCRALARHVGIEHVRPEVLPQDRAAEVRRLSRAGGVLAVVGSSIDDAALAAAPLSIDIDSRGGPLERCDIDIVSGDVRDAAVAVQLSRGLLAQTRAVLITCCAPVAAGALALIAGLPAWALPVLGLAGSLLAARRLSQRAT